MQLLNDLRSALPIDWAAVTSILLVLLAALVALRLLDAAVRRI